MGDADSEPRFPKRGARKRAPLRGQEAKALGKGKGKSKGGRGGSLRATGKRRAKIQGRAAGGSGGSGSSMWWYDDDQIEVWDPVEERMRNVRFDSAEMMQLHASALRSGRTQDLVMYNGRTQQEVTAGEFLIRGVQPDDDWGDEDPYEFDPYQRDEESVTFPLGKARYLLSGLGAMIAFTGVVVSMLPEEWAEQWEDDDGEGYELKVSAEAEAILRDFNHDYLAAQGLDRVQESTLGKSAIDIAKFPSALWIRPGGKVGTAGDTMAAPIIGKCVVCMRHFMTKGIYTLQFGDNMFRYDAADAIKVESDNELLFFPRPQRGGKSLKMSIADAGAGGNISIVGNVNGKMTVSSGKSHLARGVLEHGAPTINGSCGSYGVLTDGNTPVVVGVQRWAEGSGGTNGVHVFNEDVREFFRDPVYPKSGVKV